jgi:hypothetical protein
MAVANRKKSKPIRLSRRPTRSKKPLIFISHDSRDAKIAELFSDLLRDASPKLKSFFSSDRKGQGIEYGVKWHEQLTEKIKSASEVVCLLTPRSLYRPWIFYEAGMAAGKLRSRVLGVALGVPLDRMNAGPFGQFQNCAYDEDSLTTLVMQLMKRLPGAHQNRADILHLVKSFIRKTTRLLPEIKDPEICPNLEAFSKLGMYKVVDQLPDQDLQKRLARSKKIKVLKTWFPETRVIGDGLEAAIKSGAEVRLLLCKPESILLQQRSRTALKDKQYRASTIVYKAIKDIHDWVQEKSGAEVEIGCYDSWPGCPVIWYDDKIIMGFYFRRAPSPEWPWISVKPQSVLAEILDRQYEDLWNLDDTLHLKTQEDRERWLDENKKWGSD